MGDPWISGLADGIPEGIMNGTRHPVMDIWITTWDHQIPTFTLKILHGVLLLPAQTQAGCFGKLQPSSSSGAQTQTTARAKRLVEKQVLLRHH